MGESKNEFHKIGANQKDIISSSDAHIKDGLALQL
jgi:hypothetical protein